MEIVEQITLELQDLKPKLARQVWRPSWIWLPSWILAESRYLKPFGEKIIRIELLWRLMNKIA